jgi:hypothetical protein
MTSEKQARDEPDQPPVDGPSPGESGEEAEETGASSLDKPGEDKSESS